MVMETAVSIMETEKIPVKPGEVLSWLGDNGEKMVILAVPDLDGRILQIPQHRDDIEVGGVVPEDLKLRGVTEFTQGVLDIETEQYLGEALMRMPEVAAIQATFNMDVRPDLDEFPICFPPTPPIGITGPPWCGKTFLMLTTKIMEDDNHIRVSDWDPFGAASISNCIEDVVKSVDGNVDVLKQSLHKTVETVLAVYKQKIESGQKPDTSQLTLRQVLSELVEEYRGGNQRDLCLIDLPGYDSKSAPPHIFQLMRYAISTMDLGEEIKKDKELAGTVEKGARVPMGEKYNHVDSAEAYFIQLRRMVFNPEGIRKETVLTKALLENYQRQAACVRLVNKM